MLNRIPTNVNLDRWGLEIESIRCSICDTDLETVNHLFFSCNMAMTLWVNISKWWDIDIPVCSNMQEWVIWLDGVRLRLGVKRCLEVVCLTTMWLIWGYRNKLLFDSVKPMKGHIWDSIQVYSYFWIDSRVSKFKVSWVDWLYNPVVAINIL